VKRGTPNHPKTRELAAALGVPLYGAVGILEALWHFAAAYTRRGDIGHYPDVAIASAIDWRGEPGDLVEALVRTGWLDPCPCHRLRIHDWPEHADRAVAKTREVMKSGWLECYTSEPVRQAPDYGTHACAPRVEGVYTTDARPPHACVLPLPLPEPEPEPEPTDPPLPPPASGGARVEPEPDVHAPPGRAPGQRAGPVVVGSPPTGPARRQRAQALRDDADAAERYWIQLGGHPGEQDRKGVRKRLRDGYTLAQVQGSISERVRDELVARGALSSTAAWPPPGMAPFDEPIAQPEARASPAEAEVAAKAWEGTREALRAKLSPQAWATWIRPCRGLYVREGRIVVEVPDERFLDWIGRNWSAHLQWAAAEAGLEGVNLVVPPARAIAG
jgi:hypothetical protein